MNMINLPQGLSEQTRAFMARKHNLLIDGAWVPGSTGRTIKVLDPGSGLEISEVAEASVEDVDKAVRAARRAFDEGPWSRFTPTERQRVLLRLADLIEGEIEFLGQLEAMDNGAPLFFAQNFFINGAAELLRYMAGWATKINGDSISTSVPGDWHAYTLREPVGVVGAIVPWNVPLLNAMTKVAPALAAGCTVVLKPAEQTPLTTIRFGELAAEAGLPAGVLNIIVGRGDTGAAMVEHPLVDKIAFTGSTETGRRIAQSAAGTMKRLNLELGGKSPAIVFPDADMERTIPGVANAIFFNAGQVCVAGSRLYVHKRVFDQVVAGLAEQASAIRMGHAFDQDVAMGPLVSAEHRDRVCNFIEAGKAAGAEVVAGGSVPDRGGFFVQPTVLVNTRPDMAVMKDEIFGPVVCAVPFDDNDDMGSVVAQANASIFGLAASVWTRDLRTAHLMARRLRAGTVWVNAHSVLDFALPFGGFKQSGLSRDNGHEGVLGYTEVKSVAMQL